MTDIHYTWIGEPAPAQSVSDRLLYRDVSGPLDLIRKIQDQTIVVHFWCMDHLVPYYSEFFDVNLPRRPGIYRVPVFVHGINQFLKILAEMIQTMQEGSLQNAGSLDFMRWNERERQRVLLLGVPDDSRVAQLSSVGFIELEKLKNFFISLNIQGYRPSILKDIHSIWNYFYQYYNLFYSALRPGTRFKPFGPTHHAWAGLNPNRLKVSIKDLFAFFILFFWGGYHLDTGVSGSDVPGSVPQFPEPGHFKPFAVRHRAPLWYAQIQLRDQPFLHFIGGVAPSISLLERTTYFVPSALLNFGRKPGTDFDPAFRTNINLDVWLLSSRQADRGAYYTLVTHIKIMNMIEILTNRIRYGHASYSDFYLAGVVAATLNGTVRRCELGEPIDLPAITYDAPATASYFLDDNEANVSMNTDAFTRYVLFHNLKKIYYASHTDAPHVPR